MMKILLLFIYVTACVGVTSFESLPQTTTRVGNNRLSVSRETKSAGKGGKGSKGSKGHAKSSKSPKGKGSKSSKSPKGKGFKLSKSSKAPKTYLSLKSSKSSKSPKSAKSSKTPKSPKSSKSPKSPKCYTKSGKGGKGKGVRGSHNCDDDDDDNNNACTVVVESVIKSVFGDISDRRALAWLLDDIGGSQCNAEDVSITRYALAVFYYSTGGDEWDNNSGWLGSENECTSWFGVVCDDSNHMTQLVLESNNLDGTLPPELFEITSITTLSLFDNGIRGSIPAGIANLPLSILDLENNNFSGTLFTDEFLRLGDTLTSLTASFNDFSGNIPATINAFSKLTRLWIGSNSLGGELPDDMSGLVSLDELFLYSNNFYGGIPSSLPSGLIKLRLYDNPMTGELTIGDLAQLEELEIDNMGLEGQLPDFSGLVSLKQFYAHANDFDGPIADIFDGLTNLRDIQMQNNTFTGAIPDFSASENLIRVDLSFNDLSGELSSNIFELPNLELLYLDHNALEGPIPDNFGGSTSLKDIYLQDNLLTGAIPNVSGNILQNIEEIVLSKNKLTGPVPDSICLLRNERPDEFETLRVDCEPPAENEPPQNQCVVGCCTSCVIGKLS